MISSKAEALGIIFPNSYDSLVPDLVSERLMASIPFASRYRMCDFMISSMVHCGIDNISILVRKNYHSLLDHLGNGREWDLARKNGGLNIVPPFAQKQSKVFSGRIEALESIRGYLINCVRSSLVPVRSGCLLIRWKYMYTTIKTVKIPRLTITDILIQNKRLILG